MEDLKSIISVALKSKQDMKEFISYDAGSFSGFAPHMGGLCYYASILVFQNLKSAGLDAKVVVGQGHYFNLCGEYLVDITASQFSQPKVVVRKYDRVKSIIESNEISMNFWKAARIYDNINVPEFINWIRVVDDARNFVRLMKEKCLIQKI